MRRMLNPDKVIKTVKVADDKSLAVIGKENFKAIDDRYIVNIQTINQSPYDGLGYLNVTSDEIFLEVGMVLNNHYSISVYQYDTYVSVIIAGVIYNPIDGTINTEKQVSFENAVLDEVLETLAITGAEDFDLYVLKDN